MELRDKVIIENAFNKIQELIQQQDKIITNIIAFCIVQFLLLVPILIWLSISVIKQPDVSAEIENYFENTTELAQVQNFELYED